MSSVSLEKVIEEIKSLQPEEQIKVRELLDAILSAQKNQPTREEYEQYLLAKGVISHIPTRTGNRSEELKNFKPIEVAGEPLSEMIIRERR